MDAIKILGGLLGNRGGAGGLGRQVLQQVLNQRQHQQQHQQRQHQQQHQQQQQQHQQQHRAAEQARQQAQRAQQQRAQQGWRGGQQLDGVLHDVYGRHVQRAPAPQQQQQQHYNHGYDDQQLNERAVVLIRAMINAAKADGSIDQREQDQIVKRLEPISPQEAQFLRDEFRRPLNLQDFAHSVPRGMEQEVYSVSLMAIDLDTNPEANYLRELAESLRIEPNRCNEIHQHYGAARLYR